MDDRLWWFANRIQDVFQIGTYDSPTLLEDFISADETVEAINLFINEGGTNRLFVYSSVVDKLTLSNRTLTIYSSLPDKVKLEGHILLYFFRLCNDTRLEVETIPNNVFAGVVKDSAIQSFTTFLSEVVAPVLKSKRDWGDCSSDQVQQLLSCVDKCVHSMVESPTPSGKIVLEEAPECEDTITRRLETATPAYLAECERLILSWSATIESVLTDAFEDSRSHMMESCTGPMVEIHRWKRRHLLLTSIIEQLKTKESKAVITTLIANKSKHLKKWRSVDIIITDTANEAKDKFKYLEGLKRHIEPLCEENRISEVMNTSLHHLMMGFKQAEAASRHYSRTGFLGIIMSKVSNQLVTLCKANLFARGGYDAYEVWGMPHKMADRESLKHLHTALSECLALHKYYKESLRSLRDMLGATNKTTVSGSRRGASSVARSDGTDSRDGNDKRLKPADRKLATSQNSLLHFNAQNFGIPITDEQAILGSLDKLCDRARELIEVITTLTQLEDLAESVADIGKCGVSPLIMRHHFNTPDTPEESSIAESNNNRFTEEEETSQQLESESSEQQLDNAEGVVDSTSTFSDEINTLTMGSMSEVEGDSLDEGVHISTYIKNLIHTSYTSLMSECSSLDVILSTEGVHKDKFPDTYRSFVHSMSRLESTLCLYVKSVIGESVSSRNGLAVTKRFGVLKSFLGKGTLKQALQDLQADLFLNFEDDLERIKDLYEENKGSPPISHNAPTVASALLWIRQLVQQIEEPMKVFRENKLLMSNRDSTRIIKLYNKLATTFHKFETLWLTNWTTTVEPIRSALKATLLVHDATGKLHVNMDPKILELIQETKWLLRLNCSVPEGARDVLKQEQRIKSYVQRLKQYVKDMDSVVDTIQPAVKPVLCSQLHNLHSTIKPGLVTLTWNNVNIDAFLHRMELSTQELAHANTMVKQILEREVEVHLDTIPTLLFYEGQGGVTSMTCEDFVKSRRGVVEERFKVLTHLITQVQAGLFNAVMSAINAADRTSCVKKTPDDKLVAAVLAEFHLRINKSYMNIIKISVGNLAACLSSDTAPLFKSEIKLCVPEIVLSPSLETMQEALNQTLAVITGSIEHATWLTPADRDMMSGWILADSQLQADIAAIQGAALGIKEEITEFFEVFMSFRRYWRDDLHGEYKEFMENYTELEECTEKVEVLMEQERRILAIESMKNVEVTQLNTTPVKNSIHAMIRTWKYKYASQLHFAAKRDLEDIIKYRNSIRERLTVSVENLSSLSETLDLLAELGDLENTIDDTYLPVETTYQQLKDFDVQLPRGEVELVRTLRDEWKMLMDLADSVRQTLMIEQKLQFEQELEKQVQSFIVEVIQLRTSFESQGPGVSNISPDEAMARLDKFWVSYNNFDSKQHTLQAVQKMYGLPLTAYPDLEKTGKELTLLQTLYDLYQKYIEFDHTFKETLWQDVNLDQSNTEMKTLYKDCIDLPESVKEWSAFYTLCENLEAYLALFPVLTQLNSKQIRSRHWLQVMQVTGSTFQLEASQMNLSHLLECDLIKYKSEIEDIVACASKELDLEQKLRCTEEEWAEQVLHFSQFKNRGFLMLDARYTVSLLEMLEDSQASLASMLTSKHIGPLKDEAASWAAKLLSVSEVIEQWLSVQHHWVHLESVFSLPSTKKDLPQEAKRFASIDKTWTKLMKKTYDVKNVIQCCHGGEPPKTTTLSHLSEQLEYCQRSLTTYLDEKRKLFPRFYYVSDTVLLAILSSHSNIEAVSKHFRAIFQNIDSVILAPEEEGAGEGDEAPPPESSIKVVSEVSLPEQYHSSSQDEFTSFSESPIWSGGPNITAIGAKSAEGEVLDFNREVTMKENVEQWLESLLQVTQETISDKVYEIDRDINKGSTVEEFTTAFPCQVALLGFYLQWTRDCELAISENKLDRKALHNLARKYSNIVSRLPSILNKPHLKDDPVQLVKLENILSLAIHLREVAEDFQKKKVRDIQDFEWVRNPRYYVDEADIKMMVSDYSMTYGCEYVGCDTNQIITPLRDRYTLLFVHTIQHYTGVSLAAEAAVAKHEMAKSLSVMCARFLLSFHCSNGTTYSCISKILTGLAQEGSWGCFSEVGCLSIPTLQVLAQCLHLVLGSLQQGSDTCNLFSGQEIKLSPNFAVFVTQTTEKYQVSALPTELRGLFRLVSVPQPHFGPVLRSLCAVLGYKSGKMIADRMIMVHKLVTMQMKHTGVAHMSLSNIHQCLLIAASKRNVLMSGKALQFGRASSNTTASNIATPVSDKKQRAPTPVNLTPQIRLEHALVKQTLAQTFGLRFVKEDQLMFDAILKDVFAGTCDNIAIPKSENTPTPDIRSAFIQQAEQAGLETHTAWVTKAMQLYNLSQTYSTLIVAGPPAVGKSSILSTLINTLSYQTPAAHIHKIVRVNPLSVGSLDKIFGHINVKGEWVDGIFTAAWKKANNFRNTSTWLVMDSPLHSSWADMLHSVMQANRQLTLPNGDRMFMEGNLQLVFETDSLAGVSPAIILPSGMLYMEPEVLGWEPLSNTWLATRTAQDAHVLRLLFSKLAGPLLSYVTEETTPIVRVCNTGLFRTFINLLTAMLDNFAEVKAESNSEVLMERIVLFCLIWSLGGLLPPHQQHAFSDTVKSLTSCLPEYTDNTVYDYYVDEAGEWDSWYNLIPEAMIEQLDHFVENIDTTRTYYLMHLASITNQNILLTGPPATGKTNIVNRFLRAPDKAYCVTKTLVYCENTQPKLFQEVLEHTIVHRQGNSYGAEQGKRLCLFVDDLNVLKTHQSGTQITNEYLRSLLDMHGIYDNEKAGKWKVIKDMTVIGAMRNPSQGTEKDVAARLLRHFMVFNVPTPTAQTLYQTIDSILQALLIRDGSVTLETTLHSSIVKASCDLLSSLQHVLQQNTVPGRYHYCFNINTIVNIVKGLQRTSDSMRNSPTMTQLLWLHEAERVVDDAICRPDDTTALSKLLADITAKYFKELSMYEHAKPYFVTFDEYQDVSRQMHRQGVSGAATSGPVVQVKPVSNLNDLRSVMVRYCQQMSDEAQKQFNSLMLSDVTVEHILKIHRVITMTRGNMLCIGAHGNNLDLLVNLASFIAGMELFTVKSTRPQHFFEQARTAFRVAGSEGRQCVLLINSNIAHEEELMEKLNSALISGEIPFLFTNDEMEGLLQSLQVVMRREAPELLSDPIQFFSLRVKRNLRIVICIEPDSPYLNTTSAKFKGLLSLCQVSWMMEWPKTALTSTSSYYISSKQIANLEPNETDQLVQVIANIHTLVQSHLAPHPWEKISAGSPAHKQNTLIECIKLSRLQDTPGESVLVGPKVYQQFLDYFIALYKSKSKAENDKLSVHNEALLTIKAMVDSCRKMNEAILSGEQVLAQTQVEVEELLKQLTKKSAALEKIKAQLGCESSLLPSLQVLQSQLEDHDDIYEFLEDDYDPKLTKEERRKKRKDKIQVQLDAAKSEEEAVTDVLNKHKLKVESAFEPLDKNCLESIRVMPSPPLLVNTIMNVFVKMLQAEGRLPDDIAVPMQPVEEETAAAHVDLAKEGRRKTKHRIKVPPAASKPAETDKKEKKEREQWLIVQGALQDAQGVRDAISTLSWESGLKDKTVETVENLLKRATDEFGIEGETVVKEPRASMAARRQSIETGSAMVDKKLADRSIGKLDEAAVSYASEKVGFIYTFMIALLSYHHAHGLLRIAREQTESLQTLLSEIEEEEKMAREAADQASMEDGHSEEAVANLEVEIKDLQLKYEQAVVKKRSLQTDCQSIREKLRAMSSLTSVLKSQREAWSAVVDNHQSHLTVVANCILGAAFLAYCGSLIGEARRELFDNIKEVCKDIGAEGQLLNQDELVDFIMGDTVRYEWTAQLLPRESHFMENTMLATHSFIPQWLLIFDSEGVSEHWLKNLHQEKDLVTVSYYHCSLKTILESAITEGKILVVTEVDDQLMQEDTRFKDLITKSAEFLTKSDPVKLLIAEKEVVGSPDFRLHIVCNKKPTNHTLVSNTRLLNLTPTLAGFSEYFLQHFLAIEKNRLQEDQRKFAQEVAEYTRASSESESEILQCLAQSRDLLLRDTHAIKKLYNMKKLHTEALENLENARNSEGNVLKSREAYRPLAVRAAVIYRTSMLMARVNPLYQWSLLQFLPVFESSVKQSDRTTINVLLEQLTSTSCITYNKGLFPHDKGIFALATLLEIEDSAGNVGPGEREYLVAPISDTTARALPKSVAPPPSKRKVFEWMSDEQWQNLQVLAHHCSWFTDVFDRMNKDSAEVRWRQLCECDAPETAPLPDVLEQRVTRVQHLMVIRAVRPSRFIGSALKLAADIIGKKVISDNSLDLGNIIKTVSPRSPVLMLYKEEPENARFMIADLAFKRQQEVVSLYVGKSGPVELRQCQHIVDKALQAGQWVHLHAVHNSPDILLNLLVIINGAKVLNSNFRLWLSCEPVDTFPSAVLQSCLKICTDSPRATDSHPSFLKDGMIRSLSWINPDILSIGSRADWIPLLHNLCLIYNLFQLRGKLAPNGWKYSWTASELWESVRAAVLEFNDDKMSGVDSSSPVPSQPQGGKVVSWTALRYILGEVIYGAQVNDPLDKQVISSMMDHFITPAACKKDYEIPKTKWKLPSSCFQPMRSNTISLIISQIENNPPPETFEACLMHSVTETQATGEKCFFQQLALIYDIEAKEQVEVDTTPTPVRSSANSATVKSRDRSPLNIKSGKDIDLIETANILLQKLPKGWHKDYVVERLKKLGGSVAFSYFMNTEMSSMQSVLDNIRANLTAIKSAAEHPTIHSPTVISVAHDILYQRVPRHWLEMTGSITPNPTNTLTWIGDIVQRCSHLERALQGRERVPCLWISVFSNPEGLLGAVMHEAVQAFDGPSTNFEEFNFTTEITNRDKDHIRESPNEGMFIYGISLYGASWERTINEMQDVAPKSKFTQLPVIHVTAGFSQTDRTHCLYQCPVYSTRSMDDKPLFYLDIFNENVHNSKWALRGLCASLR